MKNQSYINQRCEGFFGVVQLSIGLLVACLFAFQTDSAMANPQDGQVIAGSADIANAGSTLTVTQNSGRAIINWGSFSIDQGELTKFLQPSSASAVLNRVTGGNLSAIHGTLQANGQVFLINPHGVVVGATGVINAGSFTASTLDVDNNQFMSGGNLNFFGDSAAKIEQLGKITASQGDVYLIAREILNEGSISAANGEVGLAGGTQVLLKQAGDDRLFVLPESADGSVANKGDIEAIKATLKATGGNAYALAINNEGVIRATGVEKENGRVILKAESGKVSNAGTITAKNADETGGEVQVLGDEVELAGGSLIDASGENGGGKVLVGGDEAGANPAVKNAKQTTVAEGAVVKVDSLKQGDAGTVVVWSDETTEFRGEISGQAKGESGNGGFVEISGKENLLATGSVDLSAENGEFGDLLFDPGTVTIQDGPNANIDFNTFNDAYVEGLLSGANVHIRTSQANNGGVEDINVLGDVSIVWNDPTQFKLTAGRSISIQSGAYIENTHVGTNFTAMDFSGNWGGVSEAQAFDGINIVSATLKTVDGHIRLSGRGGALDGHGIYASYGAKIQSLGNGQITLTGQGGDTASSNIGVYLFGVGTEVSSVDGDIKITGTGGSGGAPVAFTNHEGILVSNAHVISTGDANITLTGQGGSNGSGMSNDGVYLLHGALVQSASGNIKVTGTGDTATDNNKGVYLNQSQIASTDGNITVSGGGTGSPANSSYGIYMEYGSSIVSDGSSNISLTGDYIATAHSMAGLGDNVIGGPAMTGNITLTAARMSLNDLAVVGTGNLYVQPIDPTAYIGLGDGAGGFFILTNDSLSTFQDGFNHIYIGRSNGSHVVGIDWLPMLDDTTIRAPKAGGMINVLAGANITWADANLLEFIAGQSIYLGTGAVVESTSGAFVGNEKAVSFKANTAQQSSGNFAGILIDGAAIRSNTGNVELIGKGGDAGSQNAGVALVNGAEVASTGTNSAKINITGTGGDGVDENAGVFIGDSEVSSIEGNISIKGTGGNGSGQKNFGVRIVDGGEVNSLGGANVSITGTGGNGTDRNHGVTVNEDSQVTTVDGNINIKGTAGNGSGNYNYGVVIFDDSQVASTGTGAISITGTGGAGVDGNMGIKMIRNALVTSVNGNITLRGTGGAGSGMENYGILLIEGSRVASTGTARVSLTGTGGTGTDYNMGIRVDGLGSEVTSVDGNITLNGTGGNATGERNMGVLIFDGAAVRSLGMTPSAATVTIIGQGGTGSVRNHGIASNVDTEISSAYGNITLRGNGGVGTGERQYGVVLFDNSQVLSTGTGSQAAKITIEGNGGTSTQLNWGVSMYQSNTVASQDGDITIEGVGGTGGTGNHGVRMKDGNVITSVNGDITIEGEEGGSSGIFAEGSGNVIGGPAMTGDIELIADTMDLTGLKVQSSGNLYVLPLNLGTSIGLGDGSAGTLNLNNAELAMFADGFAHRYFGDRNGTGAINVNALPVVDDTTVQSNGAGGDVFINGQIVWAGTDMLEVLAGRSITMTVNSKLESTSGAFVGNEKAISLKANTAQASSGNFSGITLDRAVVRSNTGDIEMIGKGGDAGSHNYGIRVFNNASKIESVGTGADAAKITLNGTGGNSGFQNNWNIGVRLAGPSTRVSSIDGNISITGTGGDGSWGGNSGVYIDNGARVQSLGLDPEAAKISIVGNGGSAGGKNYGVVFSGNGAGLDTIDGNVTIRGNGGNGSNSYGVYLNNTATLVSTGAGSLSITGQGGASGSDGHGIVINGFGTGILSTTGTGAINLNGTGGASVGILLTGGAGIVSQTSAGISLVGTGGSDPAGKNYGVHIEGAGTKVSSLDGNISIRGNGGDSGNENFGILLESGAAIESTGTARVSLNGTGGNGAGKLNEGVRIRSRISSVDGNITITGQGGDGAGSWNRGVVLHTGAGLIESTGNAKITITGTGGANSTTRGEGVHITESSKVTSVVGDINITGTGGGGLSGDGRSPGIWLWGGAKVESTGSANINFTGIGAGNSAGIRMDGVPTTVGGPLATGNITFTADTMELTTGTVQSSGNLYVQPLNPGTSIGLGDGAAGILNLTNNELMVFADGFNHRYFGRSNSFGTINLNWLPVVDDTTVRTPKTDGDIFVNGQIVWAGADMLELLAGRSIAMTAGSKLESTSTGFTGNEKAIRMVANQSGTTSTTNSKGVSLDHAQVLSNTGNVEIYGRGGVGGAHNYGVYVGGWNSKIVSNGKGADAAKINITGFGGTGNWSVGVRIAGKFTEINSQDGNINIVGKGGTGNWNSHRGIMMDGGASVNSTGMAQIALNGQGGNQGGLNDGVYLTGEGTAITSVDGRISITGKGGVGSNSRGVFVNNGAMVQSMGSAPININGTGGTNGSNNYGVFLNNEALVESLGTGNVSITGQGGSGNSREQFGIYLDEESMVIAQDSGNVGLRGTGGSGNGGAHRGISLDDESVVGSYNGNVTLTGQGGTGGSFNYGVHIDDESIVGSEDGRVQINGTGGSSAGGWNHHGVWIDDDAEVVSIGTANISITGQGGTGNGGGHRGVYILDGGTVESSGSGNINVNGTGGSGGTDNHGVELKTGGQIISTGSGSITVTGTAGSSHGIYLHDGGSIIADGTGDLFLTGVGAGSGYGLYTEGGSNQIGGTTTGNITLEFNTMYLHDVTVMGLGNLYIQPIDPAGSIGLGDGAAGTLYLSNQELLNIADGFAHRYFGRSNGSGAIDIHWVPVVDDTTVRTPQAGGDITVNGQIIWDGVNLLELLAGRSIAMMSGSWVESTSAGFTGNEKAIIFQANKKGDSTGNFKGVSIDGRVASNTGNIDIWGRGGDTGAHNYGVYIGSWNEEVVSTGSGKDAAKINITGFGGEGNWSVGVRMLGTYTRVNSVDGDITIAGTGGTGNWNSHRGIMMDYGAQVNASGNANVTLTGQGGNQGGLNDGVYLTGDGTAVTAVDGKISITGKGGVGSNSRGVFVNDGAMVQSTGSAQVNIKGTGGASGSSNYGVFLKNDALLESTGSGNINVNGQGGSGGTDNHGVVLEDGAQIKSTGSGSISVTGKAGGSDGIILSNSSIVSTGSGNIGLNGTGGEGPWGNHRGVNMDDSRVVTVDGNISITGQGGHGGSDNYGIWIHDGSVVRSWGMGNISMNGTGGDGFGGIIAVQTIGLPDPFWSGNNHGVYISDSRVVSMCQGNIGITGRGGEGSMGHNTGILITDESAVRSWGTGNINLRGFGGYSFGGFKPPQPNVMIVLDEPMGDEGEGGNNHGVEITNGSEVTTVSGNIGVTGRGGEGGSHNTGILLNNESWIASFGREYQDEEPNGDYPNEFSVQKGAPGVHIGRDGAGNISLNGIGGSGTSEGGFQTASIQGGYYPEPGFEGGQDGNHHGVEIANGSRVGSIDGNIGITGQGGQGGWHNTGIFMQDGALVRSWGMGNISMNGTGGDSFGGYPTTFGFSSASYMPPPSLGGEHHGVHISDSKVVSMGSGNIGITGRGGEGAMGHNTGILITDEGAVRSWGTGKINLRGFGGYSFGGFMPVPPPRPGQPTLLRGDGYPPMVEGEGGNNHGVEITNGSEITTVSGNIGVTGQGGEGGSHNTGILLDNESRIASFGREYQEPNDEPQNEFSMKVAKPGIIQGEGAGNITLNGTGGEGSGRMVKPRPEPKPDMLGVNSYRDDDSYEREGNHHGVEIADGSSVHSEDGNISVTGQGGIGGSHNTGIYVHNDSDIVSEGNGNVSLNGRGGMGVEDEWMFREMRGFDGEEESSFGEWQWWDEEFDLRAFLRGGGEHHGVEIANNSEVASNNGNVSVRGQGGIGGSHNTGILVRDESRIKSFGEGNVSLNGTGGFGVGEWDEYRDERRGDGPSIMMDGDDVYDFVGYLLSLVLGEGEHHGVEITEGSEVSASDGNVNITGQGGMGGTHNTGVLVQKGSEVFAGCSDKVTIRGTGGMSGLVMDSWPTFFNFEGWDEIVAMFEGLDSETIGEGMEMLSYIPEMNIPWGLVFDVVFAYLRDAGRNHGVEVRYGSSVASGGSVNIVGQGGKTGSQNNGVYLHSGADVETFGREGRLSITGTGGESILGFGHNGILIEKGATVASQGGSSVALKGQGGKNLIGFNRGVVVRKGGEVVSNVSGNVNVNGVGGIGLLGNHGVLLSQGGEIRTTGLGNIKVTGQGGMGILWNHGVFMKDGAQVVAEDEGKVTVNGAGGDGLLGWNHGVFLKNGSNIQSDSGRVRVNGQGGDKVIPFGHNHGIYLKNGSSIQSNTGRIDVSGTAGGSHGVYLHNSSSITSAGNINVTGVGADGGDGIHTEGGNNLIGGPLTTGNITLTADTMHLYDLAIQGSGWLLIQSIDPALSIGLGDFAPGVLNLDSTELSSLVDGFSHIYIGRRNGTHLIMLDDGGNTMMPQDDATIRGNSITINSVLDCGANDITLLIGKGSGGVLNLNASVLTTGTGKAKGGQYDDWFAFGDGAVFQGKLYGGAGSDMLDFSKYTTGVVIDLILGTATGTYGISSFENVITGFGDDIVITQFFPWVQNLLGGPHTAGDRLIVNALGTVQVVPPSTPLTADGYGDINFAQFEFLTLNNYIDPNALLSGTYSFNESDEGELGSANPFNVGYGEGAAANQGLVHSSSFVLFAGQGQSFQNTFLRTFSPLTP